MYTKGEILGKRYKLADILGRGSFAEVWAAYDKEEKKIVAIKICKAALIAKDENEREKALMRFRDEIALMKRVKSPYVLEILDYGKHNEEIPPYTPFYYIVMDRMYSTLADYMKKRREDNKGGMKLAEFFRYATHCLLGMMDLHNKGVLHRDIKPSNLLFSQDNILTIGDLGIARLTEYTRNTQTMFGTVGYAAAELFVHKEKASVQSDLFSLGVSFYEMLAGTHPCSDKGVFYLSKETIRRLIQADFYDLAEIRRDIPKELITLIYDMTKLSPLKRPKTVKEVYDRLVKIQKKIASIYIKEAKKQLKKEKLGNAIKNYIKATHIDPSCIEALKQIGFIYYMQGHHQKALEYFSKTLQWGVDKEAYNNRGLCYYSLDDLKNAIHDFSQAINADPQFAEAYNNRGLVYHNQKEYYKAIQNFNKAIQIKPGNYQVYNNRGVTYNEQNDYDKAILDFTKAIKLKKDDAEAYFNRGLAYRMKKSYNKAIDDFTKALTYNPNDIENYYQRGLVYKKIKSYKRALKDFEKVLKNKPHMKKVQKQVTLCKKKIEHNDF